MPTIKSKRQLADEAETLAITFSCVGFKGLIYMPFHAETGEWRTTPPPEQTVWLPLDKERMLDIAREQFSTVFPSDTDLDAFIFMAQQSALKWTDPIESVLVRTDAGLKELRQDGVLHDPTGKFVPNTLPVKLNEDPAAKERVMSVLMEWLDSEEEAVALLRHLATALAPGWSAVRYVLLLGDGRNGKSVLMDMMKRLFGRSNVSNVSRQNISQGSPVVTELNGKLLNIIFDGVAIYLKDSGHEKSLIAGEEIGVRVLYKSSLTPVQTNALFIEGLNKEPKSHDKSSALQERLIRFWFTKTYEDNLLFMEEMMSDEMLGALLALLIDNYVKKEEKAVMLAPTKTSQDLRLQHMAANSLALQYLEHVVHEGMIDVDDLIGMTLADLTDEFRRWRLSDGDLGVWTVENVQSQFKTAVDFKRKSVRKNGRVTKVYVIEGFKKDTLALIADLMEEETNELVGD